MVPNPHPPLGVRSAHGLWLLAVVLGIYETGLAVAHGYAESDITTVQLVANQLVRGSVFGLAILLAQRMRGGSNALAGSWPARSGWLGLARCSSARLSGCSPGTQCPVSFDPRTAIIGATS